MKEVSKVLKILAECLIKTGYFFIFKILNWQSSLLGIHLSAHSILPNFDSLNSFALSYITSTFV